MKYKVLRALAASRRYANTKRGEKVIIRTLTEMFAVLLIDVFLFIVG
jgi:hypothetical protein